MSAEPRRAVIAVSIAEAMKRAIRTSNPLAAARASAEAADHDVDVARSGYFPQITVTGSYLRTLESEFDFIRDLPPGTQGGITSEFSDFGFGSRHTWRGGFDVTQLLWDGGRTRAGVDLAKTARRLAQLDETAQRASVVLQVTQVYYNAVLAEQLVAIGEASLELSERTLAYAQAGYQQGTTPEFDVLRAEVTRDNTRTTLVRVRAQRDLALVELRKLLGVPLDQPLQLTTPIEGEDVATLARGATGIVAGAEWLPLARARTAVDTAQANVEAATSGRLPTLAAVMSFGVVQYPPTLWPTEEWRRNWTIGVNLSYPLFTGFRTTAQIASARANRRAAEQLYLEAGEQTAVAERRVRTVVDTAQTTVRENKRSVQLARRARQIADVRYRQGVSTLLELSDAQLALDNAQVNLVAAARDLQVALVQHALLPVLPLAEATPTVVTPSPAPTAGTASGTQTPTPTIIQINPQQPR